MRKTIFNPGLWFGCIGALCSVAWSQKLVVPPQMRDKISSELTKPVNVYQLDAQAAARLESAIEAWVGQRMNFKGAQTRKSQRFPGRVTYSVEMPSSVSGHTEDSAAQSVMQAPPSVPVFFTKSLNCYSYRKLLDEPAQTRLEKPQAIQVVTDLLLTNKFVEPTQQDGFGEAEAVVRELRKKRITEQDREGEGGEELVLQGVIFRRKFMGEPVINSSVTVDLQPDTKEVLGLKHYNWTPVLLQFKLAAANASPRTLDDVLAALEEKAKQYAGRAGQASLSSVTRGWFQTDKELIPILLSQVMFPHDDHDDGYAQPINLVGRDDVFYPPKPPSAECFPSTYSTYNDWVALGKPACWCTRYQCDGDADGKDSGGLTKYRVFTEDLNLIVANWKKKINDPILDPCADIDHKDSGGLTKYRVFTGDLNILITNWKKKDTELSGNCPRPE